MVHITRPDDNPAVLGTPQPFKQPERGFDARDVAPKPRANALDGIRLGGVLVVDDVMPDGLSAAPRRQVLPEARCGSRHGAGPSGAQAGRSQQRRADSDAPACHRPW
jgi:hypothetical protein